MTTVWSFRWVSFWSRGVSLWGMGVPSTRSRWAASRSPTWEKVTRWVEEKWVYRAQDGQALLEQVLPVGVVGSVDVRHGYDLLTSNKT